MSSENISESKYQESPFKNYEISGPCKDVQATIRTINRYLLSIKFKFKIGRLLKILL